MVAKKTSVYLIDRTLAVAGEGDSLSGRLNQIVARYDELVMDNAQTKEKLNQQLTVIEASIAQHGVGAGEAEMGGAKTQ